MALTNLNKITVNKEKNFLNFVSENGIVLYRFDINTGDFWGQRKKLSRTPQGFKTALVYYILPKNQEFFNFLKLMSILLTDGSIKSLEQNSNVFKVIDKLQSIGYIERMFGTTIPSQYSYIESLKYIGENFKIFLAYFKNHPQIDISEFAEIHAKQEFFKGLSLPEGTNEDIKEIIWRYRKDFDEKQLKLFIYYLIHGLYDFFECNTEKQTSCFQQGYKRESNINNLVSKVRFYFQMCKELRIQPKKDNFFQIFVNTYRSYMLNKTVIDNGILEEHYLQKNLSFENSDFKIVLPTNKEILFEEGEAQKNCVYNHYLKKLLRKQTYIVLIRKKRNVNKSYITCEVNTKGKIVQYLGTRNSRVKDEKALSFKEEYQKYLDENF